MRKINIDIQKVRTALSDPKQKKRVQSALEFDRSAMSKVLTSKRKIEGGELLTIASVLDKDPFEFALQD